MEYFGEGFWWLVDLQQNVSELVFMEALVGGLPVRNNASTIHGCPKYELLALDLLSLVTPYPIEHLRIGLTDWWKTKSMKCSK